MTNEEAYEILRNSECFGSVELYKKDEIEAFNVALEALKAEPCENTVDREAAINTVKMTFPEGTSLIPTPRWIIQMLNDLPPVIPKQRTGKWEEFDHGMGIIFLKCPFCGEFQSKADNHNFCPNCGAKMEGDTE